MFWEVECNLYLKNIKPELNQKDVKKVFDQIVMSTSISLVKEQMKSTQHGCISYSKAEEGKLVLSLAFDNPAVQALFEEGKILITPFLSRQQRE